VANVIDDDAKQSDEWAALYEQISSELKRFGNEDAFGNGDYWLLDDNCGSYAQHKLYLTNLRLLHTPFVKVLQHVLSAYPPWEIVVAVAVRGEEANWPEMGLIIRAHEIVDGLQRRYFPPAYRAVAFEGSRPGSDRD
jgi:hypothetical protein